MAMMLLPAFSLFTLAVAIPHLRRHEPVPPRWRTAFVGVVAGAAGGLVLGIGLRLSMRIAAMMGGGSEVSVGGTLVLVLGPGLLLAPLGCTLAIPAVRAARRGSRLHPLTGAIAFLGVMLPLLAQQGELAERGNLWVNRATFGFTFVAYGFAMQRAAERLDRRLPCAHGEALTARDA